MDVVYDRKGFKENYTGKVFFFEFEMQERQCERDEKYNRQQNSVWVSFVCLDP